jgi:hypothetical protein
MKYIQTFENYGTNTVKLYHITDNPKFRLDPNFAPEDNTISIFDRSGKKGIYLTSNIEKWINGHGYHRPFLVEFDVDQSIANNPEYKERWGGEIFIPSDIYNEITISRVIPIDAYCREEYNMHGWFEGSAGIEFDTGEPIQKGAWGITISNFKNYKYTGKDVREMTRDEIKALKRNFAIGRKNRNS